jgi:hypothetical protein
MNAKGSEHIPENDRIEQLRAILERQQARAITREEASEIGQSLLIFFRALGENTANGQQV